MKSRAGYWIGGGRMGVAVIGAVARLVIGIAGISSTIDDFVRMEVPGARDVHLAARPSPVYVESRQGGASSRTLA